MVARLFRVVNKKNQFENKPLRVPSEGDRIHTSENPLFWLWQYKEPSAIPDLLMHNAHKINLKGGLLRKNMRT